ncbi:hypothetical protein PAXRUDRAFT_167345 [Paxillus rubicundulus Ve08.2h10]|uniref:DDE-1 domain-containing protein n=1 Tax=Paxillus rubicundulus Ve08.2h10 TaxID=930991 RepID=A0A0D0D9W8_9AGAM|nr:hypothetical protein PAXRUDRAFT_167345 [Paxillus rubicundulus Ve08.2h10]
MLIVRWLKKFDLKMHCSNHHICLLVDNFSGHIDTYQPTNVQVEFFEPNMTSFVQPYDYLNSIIHCFKAFYCQNFCWCAIDLDELGEHNIDKINILEGIMMAQHAWDHVSLATIKHCWNHTQIQLYISFFMW